MVLDAGRIVSNRISFLGFVLKYVHLPQVEYDKPSELLKIEKGMLKALVDESGEKEHLYAMANSAAS